MKNFLGALFVLLSGSTFGQDMSAPLLKQGSKLVYVVHVEGQDLDFFVSIDSASTDYLKLGWEISGLGSGGWIMKKNLWQVQQMRFGMSPRPG